MLSTCRLGAQCLRPCCWGRSWLGARQGGSGRLLRPLASSRPVAADRRVRSLGRLTSGLKRCRLGCPGRGVCSYSPRGLSRCPRCLLRWRRRKWCSLLIGCRSWRSGGCLWCCSLVLILRSLSSSDLRSCPECWSTPSMNPKLTTKLWAFA